ncbi:hypothetical protein COV19_05900 [Candidatus Woesearchaeota archaeon CG10_big_fil_rev_8_21_14_0_10_44_13]|nr:MAG: hypothetical protein COV19_05900 [Candidatus Woesearchaeota archaeon CG10_big_fil_rev_8_21_14_0_10_44_13]
MKTDGMNEQFKQYAKHYPGTISCLLEGYNGNRKEAVRAINRLFEIVEKERHSLPDNHGRRIGAIGVGLNELAPAAEIGTSLDLEALEKIVYVVIREDTSLTVSRAEEILSRCKAYQT